MSSGFRYEEPQDRCQNSYSQLGDWPPTTDQIPAQPPARTVQAIPQPRHPTPQPMLLRCPPAQLDPLSPALPLPPLPLRPLLLSPPHPDQPPRQPHLRELSTHRSGTDLVNIPRPDIPPVLNEPPQRPLRLDLLPRLRPEHTHLHDLRPRRPAPPVLPPDLPPRALLPTPAPPARSPVQRLREAEVEHRLARHRRHERRSARGVAPVDGNARLVREPAHARAPAVARRGLRVDEEEERGVDGRPEGPPAEGAELRGGGGVGGAEGRVCASRGADRGFTLWRLCGGGWSEGLVGGEVRDAGVEEVGQGGEVVGQEVFAVAARDGVVGRKEVLLWDEGVLEAEVAEEMRLVAVVDCVGRAEELVDGSGEGWWVSCHGLFVRCWIIFVWSWDGVCRDSGLSVEFA